MLRKLQRNVQSPNRKAEEVTLAKGGKGGAWGGGLAGSSKVPARGKVEVEPWSQVGCGWCRGVREEWLSRDDLPRLRGVEDDLEELVLLNSVRQRGSDSFQC